MHVLGDRAGAQHDAERIDGAVVDDGPSVRIGLVDRFEHVVLPPDHRQPGDDACPTFSACAAPSRHLPLAVEPRRLVDQRLPRPLVADVGEPDHDDPLLPPRRPAHREQLLLRRRRLRQMPLQRSAHLATHGSPPSGSAA